VELVTYESIQEWCQDLNSNTRQLRHRRPYVADKWHFRWWSSRSKGSNIVCCGEAVDGRAMLDVLLQQHQDTSKSGLLNKLLEAATRGFTPRVITSLINSRVTYRQRNKCCEELTDARQQRGVKQSQAEILINRLRCRKRRQIRRFKSTWTNATFLSTFGPIRDPSQTASAPAHTIANRCADDWMISDKSLGWIPAA